MAAKIPQAWFLSISKVTMNKKTALNRKKKNQETQEKQGNTISSRWSEDEKFNCFTMMT